MVRYANACPQWASWPAHGLCQVTGRALICSAHPHVARSRYPPLALSSRVLILCNIVCATWPWYAPAFQLLICVQLRCNIRYCNSIGVVISPCQVTIYLLGIFEVPSDYAKWKRFAEALQQFIAMHWSGSDMWIKFWLYHLFPMHNVRTSLPCLLSEIKHLKGRSKPDLIWARRAIGKTPPMHCIAMAAYFFSQI